MGESKKIKGAGMRRDLKLKMDDVWLNVRCGAVMRYEKKVILEISTVGRNSVVPGGRIRIGEHSKDALLRELKEEMDFSADREKLRFRKVFENFFLYDGEEVHEIYFLYEYDLSKEEYEGLQLADNMDNDTTYFKFIPFEEMEKYNLLPTELYEIIRN